MKKPQRKFSNTNDPYWNNMISRHNARVLKNGENPIDYPNEAVAFETQNFGWILSKPVDGKRRILLKE